MAEEQEGQDITCQDTFGTEICAINRKYFTSFMLMYLQNVTCLYVPFKQVSKTKTYSC